MNRVFSTGIIFTVCLLFFSPGAAAAEKLAVFVSIVPQKYFVEKIGGDLVDVAVLVKPGANPATYEPRPQQMTRLSRTKIYYAIGVPFESVWLKKITAANPEMRVVRTDAGIDKIPMGYHSHSEKQAQHHSKQTPPEKNSKHHRETPDPHIWLSPPLVRHQAESIFQALVHVDPANHSIYKGRYTEFANELAEIHQELTSLFDGKHGLEFIVFHPSWGYFADAYGLKQVAIEIEGKAPKPAQLAKLIAHCKEHSIKVVFVQPQFSAKSAELVAREIGGQVIVADPLAENWSENLRMVAKKFQTALKKVNQ
jgi:zinc transport system substrate-binding protein